MDPTPESVPDSISFSILRQLHTEKSDLVDFSNPRISHDIGDLTFLLGLFMKQKLAESGIGSHHLCYMADVLVTSLRAGFQDQVKKLKEQGAPMESIENHVKIASHLAIAEGILDSLVNKMVKDGGFKSPKPSFALIKSIKPDIRPHEVNAWIEGIGDVL